MRKVYSGIRRPRSMGLCANRASTAALDSVLGRMPLGVVGNHLPGPMRINDRLWPPGHTVCRTVISLQVITTKKRPPEPRLGSFQWPPTARNPHSFSGYKRSHRHENILRGRDLLERELGRTTAYIEIDTLLNASDRQGGRRLQFSADRKTARFTRLSAASPCT